MFILLFSGYTYPKIKYLIFNESAKLLMANSCPLVCRMNVANQLCPRFLNASIQQCTYFLHGSELSHDQYDTEGKKVAHQS